MIQANILQFEMITKEKLKYVTKKGDDLIGHPLGRADGGNRTHDPEITNHVLWPTELHRQYCFAPFCKRLFWENGLQWTMLQANNSL